MKHHKIFQEPETTAIVWNPNNNTNAKIHIDFELSKRKISKININKKQDDAVLNDNYVSSSISGTNFSGIPFVEKLHATIKHEDATIYDMYRNNVNSSDYAYFKKAKFSHLLIGKKYSENFIEDIDIYGIGFKNYAAKNLLLPNQNIDVVINKDYTFSIKEGYFELKTIKPQTIANLIEILDCICAVLAYQYSFSHRNRTTQVDLYDINHVVEAKLYSKFKKITLSKLNTMIENTTNNFNFTPSITYSNSNNLEIENLVKLAFLCKNQITRINYSEKISRIRLLDSFAALEDVYTIATNRDRIKYPNRVRDVASGRMRRVYLQEKIYFLLNQIENRRDGKILLMKLFSANNGNFALKKDKWIKWVIDNRNVTSHEALLKDSQELLIAAEALPTIFYTWLLCEAKVSNALLKPALQNHMLGRFSPVLIDKYLK